LRKPALGLIILLALATAAMATLNIPDVDAQAPTIALSKIYNMNQTGTTFLVNITITDATEMMGWLANLSWDPNMIRITTGDTEGLRKRGVWYNIYQGDLMQNASSTSFLVNSINQSDGSLKQLACLFVTGGFTVSGSGRLVSINFTLFFPSVNLLMYRVTASCVSSDINLLPWMVWAFPSKQ